MKFKSLLSAAVVMCASASAFAFPTITVYPTPGDIDDVQYFSTVNILSTAPVSIVDKPAMPYFESLEEGDVVTAENFFESMGSIIVSFDETNFSANGEWDLIIPAGCLEDASGEKNTQLTFSYNLNDPNVIKGNFPQITLTSSNPANGAKLYSWGEAIGKMTFVTSDDTAVNYIDWTLWDITNGTEEGVKEYVTSGEENRIDLNRHGNTDDQWANGLYISMTGDYKLIEGHTYRVNLRFCGIGYNPETNQYPTPQQKEKSLELETYLDFTGLTEGTEYSPYDVETIMPDPTLYEFIDVDQNSFTIVYSGPVKPVMFTTPMGFGAGNIPAGTFEVATDVETVGDGYATTWDFFFDKDVLKQAQGNITVVIQAKDQDGLFVKGNGGFEIDNFEYSIEWMANAGAPKLTMVDLEDGAIVKEISSITISNDANKVMALAWNAESNPRIISRDGSFDQVLEDPTFSDDELSATFTFEPITKPGIYTFIIYKGYFNMGTESEGTTSNQTNFTFTIEGEEEPGEVEMDLLPASVSIEDNAVLTEALTSIVLNFADVTYMPLDPMVPGQLYRSEKEGEEYSLVEDVTPVENDFFSPTEYTYTFETPVSLPGLYKFVIPQGAYFDEEYDMSDHQSGHISPELVYNFKMGDGSGVSAIVAENGVATVYDIAGRVVLRDADAAQLNTLAEGVYIINGKKYVVK